MYGYGYPFQPTRPLRDATRTGRAASALSSDFNPRVPCGTRLAHTITAASSKDFNPRVPCGTRLGFGKSCGRLCTFQPTRPLRDATATIMPTAVLADHFNPRVPCGTRLLRGMEQDYMHLFQPTRPLRDATQRQSAAFVRAMISTHASLAGRDSKSNEKILIRFAQMIQSGSDMLRFSAGFYPFVSFFSARFALCTVRTAREFSVRCSFAVRQSARLPEHIRSWRQNARCAFHTGCQDSKTAGCPFFRP